MGGWNKDSTSTWARELLLCFHSTIIHGYNVVHLCLNERMGQRQFAHLGWRTTFVFKFTFFQIPKMLSRKTAYMSTFLSFLHKNNISACSSTHTIFGVVRLFYFPSSQLVIFIKWIHSKIFIYPSSINIITHWYNSSPSSDKFSFYFNYIYIIYINNFKINIFNLKTLYLWYILEFLPIPYAYT